MLTRVATVSRSPAMFELSEDVKANNTIQTIGGGYYLASKKDSTTLHYVSPTGRESGSSDRVNGVRPVITLKSNNPINIFITVDYLSYEIKNFKEMVIKYNGEIAKMAYHNKESFIERLKRTFLID